LKIIENYIRSLVNEVVDKGVNRLIQDQYIENLFEMVPASKKVGIINLVELAMRASQGKPISRPLGSHYHLSPWEKLLFNPVHLFHFPTPETETINTSVTIGKNSKKPLNISIPIMIAAMSFGGALSKSAKIALAKGASWLELPPILGKQG
jgi:glutamate synthase domain-containing protein 2